MSSIANLPVALALLGLAGCKHPHARPAPARAIPMATGPIHVDGEWDEPDWAKHALRGQFLGDDGQLARPSSEIRLLHDATTLYVGLYAADDDIRTTDAFVVQIGARRWTVHPTGAVEPSGDGVHAAVDHDGSLDDASNHDEEWVVELVVPLAVAGIDRSHPVSVHASRCDTPIGQAQRCGSWAGDVELR
jgi:hypothetical protein